METGVGTLIATAITSNFSASDVVTVGGAVLGAVAVLVIPLRIAPRWGLGLLKKITKSV